MKVIFITSMLLFISCTSPKKIMQSGSELKGEYVLNSDKLFQAFSDMNYNSLVLNDDGTYVLNKAKIKFTPVIEQCAMASKGKWSTVSNDVLELTSEDKYEKQKGFEYEIKKEKKFSQDSLYFQVVFPTDFHPVTLDFGFNNKNWNYSNTGITYVVLAKSKYLWPRNTINPEKDRNLISFSVNADVLGTTLYKRRVLFKFFEEYFETEKYNYFTITLPNFDRCFFEFEPYNQELIYIKNKNQLMWNGAIWEK